MSEITIRRVEGEALLDSYYPLVFSAFRKSPDPAAFDPDELRAKSIPYYAERYTLVLFEDDQPMATASSIPMTQTLRGKVFPMGGIGAVASSPLGRRKGNARQVVTALYPIMRESGQPISTLYPFRESFYGRLGYIQFPQVRTVEFPASGLGSLLKHTLPGEVEFCAIRDGIDLYSTFLSSIQPQVHGMALRPPGMAAQLRDQNKYWVAFARVNGDITGAMLYQITGFREELRVAAFFCRDALARHLLLAWLARHIDQVRRIWINMPPDQRLETWLYDLDVELHTRKEMPTPMGRVIDARGLSGMAAPPGASGAELTIRLTDPHCAWNNGVFRFEEDDGLIRVTANPRTYPDCDLTIEGLSALVFTGADPGEFTLRGWGTPPLETQATMRLLFPPAWTYVHEDF